MGLDNLLFFRHRVYCEAQGVTRAPLMGACAGLLALLGSLPLAGYGQAKDAKAALAPVKTASMAVHNGVTETGPSWNSLTETERETLSPLASSWGTMSEGHKRKWIKIADGMVSMDTPERNKLHERMEDWAKLSRAEREQARLNFAQSKVAGKSERQASWEAYQALSPEERQKLAEKAPQKPVGSTFVIKPVPREKLIDVPFTRRTPPEQRAAASAQLGLQRSTLLPAPAAAGASAPVKP